MAELTQLDVHCPICGTGIPLLFEHPPHIRMVPIGDLQAVALCLPIDRTDLAAHMLTHQVPAEVRDGVHQ